MDNNEINDTSLSDEINNDGTDDASDKSKHTPLHYILEIVLYISVILLCMYIVPQYVIQRTVINGESMMDNLDDGDNVIVYKLPYCFEGSPDRFDVIVFYPYGRDDKDDYYVKRVIGLPGETIQIIGSDIYVNNEIIEENYGKDPITDSGLAAEPITLKDDEFFVLGDNREISEDSRFFGPVKSCNIEGRVVLRVYPFNKIKAL